MKLPKNLSKIVLGVWLVLWGLLPLLRVTFSGEDVILEVLAIPAGILILIGR